MPNQHKTTPKAVRMPDGLLARVETAAKRLGETVNAFIVGAIEEKVERCEGGSTAPAEVGSTTRRIAPKQAPAPRSHAVNCKCGTCRPKNGGQ